MYIWLIFLLLTPVVIFAKYTCILFDKLFSERNIVFLVELDLHIVAPICIGRERFTKKRKKKIQIIFISPLETDRLIFKTALSCCKQSCVIQDHIISRIHNIWKLIWANNIWKLLLREPVYFLKSHKLALRHRYLHVLSFSDTAMAHVV